MGGGRESPRLHKGWWEGFRIPALFLPAPEGVILQFKLFICALIVEHFSVDAEIADLRRKISNLGSVNMDALDELTDLETRYNSLAGQYQDLVAAKETLERIIQKINTDSRRLFSETLEAIRSFWGFDENNT